MSAQSISLEELDRRLRQVEQQLAGLARAVEQQRPSASLPMHDENALARELLRRAGLVSEPTEREKVLAAEWEAIPADERERLFEEARAAAPDVDLAKIVIENRR